MIADIRGVVARSAGSHDCLCAGGQTWHVADGERLGIKDQLAAIDGSLLRIAGVLPSRVDGESVRIERLSVRITAQGIVDTRVILLRGEELWPALRPILSI